MELSVASGSVSQLESCASFLGDLQKCRHSGARANTCYCLLLAQSPRRLREAH